MAKRATLSAVPSYLPGTTSATAINDSDDKLNAAFDNTLSRDGSIPNTMLADFDMNSNDILNVDTLNVCKLKLDGVAVSAVVSVPVFHGVRVYNTTVALTTTGSLQDVLFDTDDYDDFNMHSTVTDTEQLVADVAGYWIAIGQFDFATAFKPQYIDLGIDLNGGGFIGEHEQAWGAPTSNTFPHIQVITDPILLAVGDSIKLRVASTPGATSKTGKYTTSLSMYLVGTA